MPHATTGTTGIGDVGVGLYVGGDDESRRSPGGPTGNLMGSYVDAHTEEVTRVRFKTVSSPQTSQTKTILATASEDGLIAIHDPSQSSEEAALVSVLNVGAPLRDVGFFGPNREGCVALTGNETMGVYHWDAAQNVSDVGGVGLRGLLGAAVEAEGSGRNGDGMGEGSSVEYLVGCTWEPISTSSSSASPALHLLAGNSEGDGYLFRIDADRITPVAHLRGGHRGCIRGFCWVETSGGRRLVTGGEDARLCEWDPSGNASDVHFGGKKSPGKQGGGGPVSARTAKSAGGGKGKGKKKKHGSPY